MTKKDWLKRIAKITGVLVLLLVAIGVGSVLLMSEPRPVGQSGEAADALATRIETAAGVGAWTHIPWVQWNFADRNQHLWDRTRGYSRVRWDEVEVLQSLGGRWGIAFEDGMPVSGSRKQELVEEAYALFCNDSFWLNPIAKFRDPGVTRSLVEFEGNEALMISYESGGVTPGDAYLYVLGDDDRPIAWHMWVSIIPVGGVRASFDDWTNVGGGAMVSSRHELGFMTLNLTDIEAGEVDLQAAAEDPFQALIEASGE